MAVTVNYTALLEQANGIINSFSDLDSAIEQAHDAAEQAVASVGGNSTRVGRSVSSVIQELTSSELVSSKTIITDLAASLQNVSNKYEEEDDFLVGKINNIASSVSKEL